MVLAEYAALADQSVLSQSSGTLVIAKDRQIDGEAKR